LSRFASLRLQFRWKAKLYGNGWRFAINILSLDTSKESTRKKRKRAAWDENYLLNRLSAILEDVVAFSACFMAYKTLWLALQRSWIRSLSSRDGSGAIFELG